MRRRRRSLHDPQSFGDFDPKDPYAASFLTTEELRAGALEPSRHQKVRADFRQLARRETRDPRFANTFEMANFPCDSDDDEGPIGLVPTPQPSSRLSTAVGAQFTVQGRIDTPGSIKFEASVPKTEAVTPPVFKPVAPSLLSQAPARQPVVPRAFTRPSAPMVRPPTGFPDLSKIEASAWPHPPPAPKVEEFPASISPPAPVPPIIGEPDLMEMSPLKQSMTVLEPMDTTVVEAEKDAMHQFDPLSQVLEPGLSATLSTLQKDLMNLDALSDRAACTTPLRDERMDANEDETFKLNLEDSRALPADIVPVASSTQSQKQLQPDPDWTQEMIEEGLITEKELEQASCERTREKSHQAGPSRRSEKKPKELPSEARPAECWE